MAAPPASRCSLPVLSRDPFPAGWLRQNCPDAHPGLRFDPDCFFSSFWFPFFSMLLFAGRKARPGSRRIPQTQTSGAASLLRLAPPRGFIPSGLTQPSIGDLRPTAALESLPVLRFRFGSVVVCQSHFRSQSNAPASPPVQLNQLHA